jgi:LmbE family N-acetylglucosaminyl deacetylase
VAHSFAAAVVEQRVENQGVPRQLPLNEWKGKNVMFIYAHIDDMEASSGGTVALLQGIANIHLVILTNGDKGCGNPDVCGNSTNQEVAVIRQE